MQRVARRKLLLTIAGAVTLAGCVHVPQGPQVMVMPGRGKSFEAFEYDDRDCRDFAASRVHTDARRANDSAVTGAAVGAGVGLLGGTAVAANESDYGRWSVQRSYDVAYTQCMYAKGNQVPVARSSRAAAAYSTPPPPPSSHARRDVPAPPRGHPPAPPPDVDY